MRTIFNTTLLSVEGLAAFLGMELETFRTWRQRDGLLAHRSRGRGRKSSFDFEDALRAYVAYTLNEAGAPAGASAAFSNECDAFGAFMAGRALVVPFHAGAPVLGEADPDRDARFVIPLEDFGRAIAAWIAHHAAATVDPATGGYGGPRVYEAAMADFEARIAEARRQ